MGQEKPQEPPHPQPNDNYNHYANIVFSCNVLVSLGKSFSKLFFFLHFFFSSISVVALSLRDPSLVAP